MRLIAFIFTLFSAAFAMESKNYVIVTGGAGYIGSHTCKALNEAGYTPVTVDDLSTGEAEFVKWGPFEKADIRNKEAVDALFAKYKPVGVCHFAAKILVEESTKDPLGYYDVNVTGALNVIRAAVAHGVKSFVFSSSCSVYGNITTSDPVDESHLLSPVSPYAETKRVIESALQASGDAHGMPYSILRYFNAAGADVKAGLGFHMSSPHLIPTIVKKVKANETIQIFGNDYPTRDGTCVRDYVHVSDLADAHVKALDYNRANNQSLILNLGSEKGYSVKEITDAAAKILKQELKIEYKDRRPGDVIAVTANATKAKNLLKWELKHSSLEEIIQSSFDHMAKK